MPISTRKPLRRADIQALRALAVLLVVLNHARVPYLPGGFLGVDIFFVISGYLMMGLIVDAADAGRFTFQDFYARRIRRLLPAAYATTVVTAVAAPFLLDSFEYGKFVQQLAGAFTFTVNMVLWRQIDYFDSGAALKPLLHMWSLAVEEQYYLILPFLTVLCRPRWRLAGALLLTGASAAICFYAVQRSPSAAFYFLPPRAWELGVGSVTALIARRGVRLDKSALWLRPLCALALLVIPFIATEHGHPGFPATAVCLATALLLITGQHLRPAGPLAPLVAIGDRSYSLYLVHWPLFAFANNVSLDPPSAWTNAALLAACFMWMEAQYRLVEQPLRHFRITWRSGAILLLVPLLTVGTSALFSYSAPHPNLADREWNTGLSPHCAYKSNFVRETACESAPHARVLLWGDSVAMHLGDGLLATTDGGLIQETRTVCGPFLGLAPFNGALYQRAWAESCIRFNRDVMDDLAKRPNVQTVVLSSALSQFLPEAEQAHWQALEVDPVGYRSGPQNEEQVLRALTRTVAAIRALNKRVVLVAPPPSASFNIGRCVDRLQAGLWTVASPPQCGVDRSDYERRRRPVLKFLAEVERRGIAPVIYFDPFLCDARTCRTQGDGRSLYLDGVHLSHSGSKILATQMQLGALVVEKAR